MTLDELEALCTEAARDLAARHPRPLPATVVLPGANATAVTTLEGFPDDDIERFDALSRFAADRIRPAGVPAYGFLAEASLQTDVESGDVLVVVYGARRHRPRVMAAPLGTAPRVAADQNGDTGSVQIGSFSPSEPLDPTAMPFLAPLQHAVDAAEPPDVTGGAAIG